MLHIFFINLVKLIAGNKNDSYLRTDGVLLVFVGWMENSRLASLLDLVLTRFNLALLGLARLFFFNETS
jgi:hypothetical protein